jgi:hypothetical protein
MNSQRFGRKYLCQKLRGYRGRFRTSLSKVIAGSPAPASKTPMIDGMMRNTSYKASQEALQ